VNPLHKSILLAAILFGIVGVWAAFSAADPAPNSVITHVEAGDSARSEAIAPMSSLRKDWNALPLEPTPATF
jgi:hypothetical protein